MNPLIWITKTLFGTVEICGRDMDILSCVNAMAGYNIPISKYEKFDNGSRFVFPLRHKKRFDFICQKMGLKFDEKTQGLPGAFIRHKKRAGLFIGGAIGLALILISDMFIWKIELVGNEYMSDEEILTCLEELGLKEGIKKDSVDLRLICVNAELKLDRLAWMAINYNGTKAVVELRERIPKPNIPDLSTPTNLIAARDGQVIYAEATYGKSEVKRGEVVSEGQLLVSGIVDSPVLGFKATRSVGRVIASTVRNYEICVSKTKAVKKLTGRSKTYVTLSVFSENLSFGKQRSPFEHYDVKEEKSDVVLFSRISLPMRVSKITYTEYEEISVSLSDEEALDEARRQLAELVGAECGNAEITSQKEEKEIKEDKVILRCTLDCIEDIVKEVPINLEGILQNR